MTKQRNLPLTKSSEDLEDPKPEAATLSEATTIAFALEAPLPIASPVEESPVGEKPVVSDKQLSLLVSDGGQTVSLPLEPVSIPPLTEDEIQSCKKMLRKMDEASQMFYAFAKQSGVHAFIEFCGLMNEYIVVCQEAMTKHNVDFSMANVHAGIHLPIESHNLQYLGEKLSCIFAPMLAHDDEKTVLFIKALLSKLGRKVELRFVDEEV